MPTIEIDELEFQQNKTLRDAVTKIMANPKAKRKLLEAEKIINPEKKIPEIDEPDPVQEALTLQRKEFEDYKKAQEEKDSKRQQDDTLRTLKSQKDEGIARLRSDGWMKEAIEEVEKIMEEKGILDPAIAAAYYEKMHPPADPVSPGGINSWNFIDPVMDNNTDEYTKQLLASKGDDMGHLAAREAQKTITEMRRQTQRR